jgi:PAS domain S-box-containing protein
MEQKTRMVLYEFRGCDSYHPFPDAYRKHASFFGAATAALGLLGLSGWILGMPLLASIRSSYIPMAPLTAIAFLCLGGVLLVHSMGSPKSPVALLAPIVSALLSAYGLIELIEYLGTPVLSLEERLFPDPPMVGAILTGRMSPTTAALLLLSGAVVPMLFLRGRGGERRKIFGDLAGCLGSLSAMTGTVFILSYLHGAPLLYGTSTIPMAATTALAYLLLGAGQLLAVGPDGFPSRLFSGHSVRARLLRAFVSTTVGVVAAIDLMHVYARGIFFAGDALLSGVSTTFLVVVTGALIARVALKVGNDMDRSEEIRRGAEEKLRESEDRYRDLVEHSQELICTHDLKGRILSVNPWTATVLGYTPEELLRMNFQDLLVPELRHGFETYLGEMRTRGTARGRMWVQTRKGERLLWEYKNTLRTEGVAEPIVRGMAQDITERTRAEERSKRAFQLESALLRIDTQILEGADARGVMGTACAAIVEMGYRMCWIGQPDPERIVRPIAYKGFTDGYLEKTDIRWDDTSEGKGPTGIALRTGQPTVVQSIRESPIFGPWRERAIGHGYLSMGAFPLKSEAGAVIGVLDVYSDREGAFGDEEVGRLGMFAQQCSIALMNARRIETLRDVNQRLAFYVDRMPLAYIVWDLEFAVVEWNPAAERIFGWKAIEAIGKRPYEFIVPTEARTQVETVWSKLIEGGESGYSVNANVRKDGKNVTCEWFNALLRDASGNVSGVLSMAHDITEKAEMERQLQTAQRMEAVGTLAGGIAHDFNNALTGIVGFGELLRMRMAGDEQALHDLDEIQRCAERAATLTRQLLTFARRQVIEPVNLSLSALVADLMKLIGKVVGEQIDVKTSLGKNVPTIHADRGQIEQVLMNLCLNSRDAMSEGGRLVVETEDVVLEEEYVRQNPYMKTGRYALLTVSDTGVGMSEKTRERVFEPFFTTKGPDKGTGLGLSMVYGIVKQHGGYIHLYSEPGEGTAFKVYFPAIEAQPDAVPTIRSEEIVRGGTETILLAEDEEAIRALAGRILIEFGYTVLVARNGEEAIEMFRGKKEIVLAVLDVVMPKKGGKEAFEEMQKENPELKVIFMSGYSANAIHESFVLTAGMPFLQKPFSPTTLARKVREVLDTQ